jgi:hypothetical protein
MHPVYKKAQYCKIILQNTWQSNSLFLCWGVFQDKKETEWSTVKILAENLLQSAFNQTLGIEVTFK